MTEQAKLAAIIRPMLPRLVGELSDRWASDIADAIIDSGQWVPRSALTAMSLRIDSVLAYADSIDHPDHRINEEGSDTCRTCGQYGGRAYWPCVYRRHAEEIRAAVAGAA